MLLELVIGDWSDDGYGKTDKVLYRTNSNKKCIMEAYDVGTEKLGFNLVEDTCRDYEDNDLTKEQYEALKALGFSAEEEGYLKEDYDKVSINCYEFADAYVRIVKLGNPAIEIEIEPTNTINLYGLFY